MLLMLWLVRVSGMVADERLATYMPSWLVIAVFYALPYIVCGYEVLSVGLKSILKGDFFNEFTLRLHKIKKRLG